MHFISPTSQKVATPSILDEEKKRSGLFQTAMLVTLAFGTGSFLALLAMQTPSTNAYFLAAWTGAAAWFFLGLGLSSNSLRGGLLHSGFAISLFFLAWSSVHGQTTDPVLVCGLQAAWAAAHLDSADEEKRHSLYIMWAVVNLSMIVWMTSV